MWRINDEAEGRIVNATINVLDRVHKQYLTMCQTEVTTKNIEFSFLINRLMVKYTFKTINSLRNCSKLTQEAKSPPQAKISEKNAS